MNCPSHRHVTRVIQLAVHVRELKIHSWVKNDDCPFLKCLKGDDTPPVACITCTCMLPVLCSNHSAWLKSILFTQLTLWHWLQVSYKRAYNYTGAPKNGILEQGLATEIFRQGDLNPHTITQWNINIIICRCRDI